MVTRHDLQYTQPNEILVSEAKKNPDYELLCSGSTDSSMKKKRWRRKRKDCSQINVLIEEFNRSSTWTKEQVASLMERTGLSQGQVYKWGWDYKKKLKKRAWKVDAKVLECEEMLPPSKLDLDIVLLQRDYKDFLATISLSTATELIL